MALSFTFNGVDFATLNVFIEARNWPLFPNLQSGAQEIAGADGAIANPSRITRRSMPTDVVVSSGNETQLQLDVEAMAVALSGKEDAQLIFDDMIDRYWNARVVGQISPDYIGSRVSRFSIPFVAHDPHAFDVSESTDSDSITVAAGQDVEYVVGGTSPAYPVYIITVNASATQIVLANDSDTARVEWNGSLVSGDALRVTTDPSVQLFEKKFSGEDSWTNVMEDITGHFPALLPADTNTISVAGFTGTLGVSWYNRFI